MRKKVVAMLLAGTVALAVLSGCGNKSNGEITPTPTVAVTATETPVPTETPIPTLTDDISEVKVTLGQYKGLTLYEVDSSIIAEELVEMMKEYAEAVVVDRAAKEGDIVNINYVGKKDGVAFEGGTNDSEAGYNLELGSGSFIDGFEEGLIGAVAGEVRDLNLTFPDNYSSAELAGQSVVFTVTVNKVQENVVPELTDDFAKEHFGVDTVAEYVIILYEARNEESFYDQITDALMATSTVENYPADVIEYEKQSLIEYYTGYAEMYGYYLGMETEAALTYMFGFESMEVLENYCEEYAFNVVKNMLVLTEVATQENLTLSQKEYEQRAYIYALSYGYEDVDTFEADYGKDAITEAITMDYIMDYIISQANIVEADYDAVINQAE